MRRPWRNMTERNWLLFMFLGKEQERADSATGKITLHNRDFSGNLLNFLFFEKMKVNYVLLRLKNAYPKRFLKTSLINITSELSGHVIWAWTCQCYRQTPDYGSSDKSPWICVNETWRGHLDYSEFTWTIYGSLYCQVIEHLVWHIMLQEPVHFENYVYSVKVLKVKGKKKVLIQKTFNKPVYKKSRNHHGDLLRNIENTSSFGKHYALNCWIILHFNVQICSLAFCWKDQTIWHFVWDINALGRCSTIY